jgi:glycosyltransferase involved in cell wall biosynthesis
MSESSKLETEAPLVSVAIISYNQAAFLKECVDSVLAQDYKNLEIVVADDGSTDGTQELLRRYDGEHPGKFVLRLASENAGITVNSNAAHFASTGKYVAWMGGDDLMLPGKISAQVALMESEPNATLCYHDLDVFDSVSDKSIGRFSDNIKPRSGSFEDVVAHGVFNGACSTMVRRDCAPRNGFDSRLVVASDWMYWMEALRSGGEIYYIDRVFARYRRHDGNITGTSRAVPLRNFQDHLAAVSYLLAENPELSGCLFKRQSDLLRGLRNYDEGSRYRSYLRASLRSQWNWKSFLGLVGLMLNKRF